MNIEKGTSNSEPNEATPFKVKSTEEIDSFNLVILSKGMLIISQFIQRSEASKENIVDLSFTSSIAQKLSPSARVVVWYMTDKNEVITDSLDFNVEGVFSNEVSLSFDKNKTQPGKSLNLKVTAAPASYVGLLAVDQSVLLLKGGNDITQKDVIEELKTYDSKDSNDRPIEPMPFMRCMFCGWPVFSGGSDSTGVFNSAGVYVITNGLVYQDTPLWAMTTAPMTTTEMMTMPTMMATTTTTMMPPGMRPDTDRKEPERSLSEPTVTRSHFPETWLWSDMISGYLIILAACS
ncbi:hypothetical protein LSAT2_027941 [Lamellibrachia satsuma]|nr:hypothetical protein LSAT2_027941 [Lamellibrachia satsuma]